MIAFIEGEVAYATGDSIILDVGGVGYQIYVPSSTSLAAEVGSRMRLFTHQHVREDAILLYGFREMDEKELFILLQNVSGIGPKAALSILSSGSLSDIVWAIQNENVDFLTQVPGVGKKTAQRILIDLRDKVGHMQGVEVKPTLHKAAVVSKSAPDTELIEALMGLGYNEKEARHAAKSLAPEIEQGAELSTQIKAALQLLLRT